MRAHEYVICREMETPNSNIKETPKEGVTSTKIMIYTCGGKNSLYRLLLT